MCAARLREIAAGGISAGIAEARHAFTRGLVTAIVLRALATITGLAQSIEGADVPCSVTAPNGTPATGQRAPRGINWIHGIDALSVTAGGS